VSPFGLRRNCSRRRSTASRLDCAGTETIDADPSVSLPVATCTRRLRRRLRANGTIENCDYIIHRQLNRRMAGGRQVNGVLDCSADAGFTDSRALQLQQPSSRPLRTAKLRQPPIGRDYASTGRLSLTAHGQISLSMMCRLVAPPRLADGHADAKTSATVPLGVEIPRRARSSFAIAHASRREEKWGVRERVLRPSSYLHKSTRPWSWPRKQRASSQARASFKA
jgi:hypothetical protein